MEYSVKKPLNTHALLSFLRNLTYLLLPLCCLLTAAVDVPGPSHVLQSMSDVGTIFFEGLHVAMLKFSQLYGPVCRSGCLKL
jgi:hypothetical protein